MIILKIEKPESEAKCLGTTNAETEAFLSELKEEIEVLLHNLKASKNKTVNISSISLCSLFNYQCIVAMLNLFIYIAARIVVTSFNFRD